MSEQAFALLAELAAELEQLGLWSTQPPSAEALASRQPFCVDTLRFEQWLQFVFMPRVEGLLRAGQCLPGKCDITPMAEQSYAQSDLPLARLLALLTSLDTVLSPTF
jgi:uncharacterized protein YqcC (DUF446 family)